jgi:basic membrane protein A
MEERMIEKKAREAIIHGRLAPLGVLACMVAAALAIAACGSSNSSSSGGSTASLASNGGTSAGSSGKSGGGKLGAAFLGPKNDQSINQAGYQGLLQAVQANPGLKLTAVLDNQATTQQQATAIQTLSPINNYVYALSDAFSPVIDLDASRFPHTKFIGMEAYPPHFHPNVYSAAVDWGASSYVAGVIAGHLTKSKTIGFIGGAEIPPTTQSRIAFAAGAHSVDPSIKVLNDITGNFADVSLGKQAAAAMIQQGADVILPWLDAGVVGAYEAGKTSGKSVAMFKLTIPACNAYSNVIGTELVNETAITKQLVTRVVKGTEQPGAVFVDLKDPSLQTLALCPKYQANSEIASVTKATIDGINSGKIKLPSAALNPRPTYHWTAGFGG